jgi:outer membrane lipase/esterase
MRTRRFLVIQVQSHFAVLSCCVVARRIGRNFFTQCLLDLGCSAILASQSWYRPGQSPVKKTTVTTSLVACFAVAGFVYSASASSFDNVFVFGDSTVDTGWFRYQPLPIDPTLNSLAAASLADGGRIPDTPYGIGAAQVLAAAYGLNANPADNGAGGTNYAASGAQDNANFINPHAPSTVSQMTNYLLAHGGAADPNALYLVSSGGNDIKYAQTLSGPSRQAWVDNAATALANKIAALQAAGAKNIIVSNEYYVGTTPPGPTTLFTRYWHDLFTDLNALNVTFKLADVQSMETSIFANPSAYGFTSISNVDGLNGTALTNPDSALIPNSWALYGTTALLRSPNAAQTSFWADDEHFAAHAQQLEGALLIDVANTPLPAALPLFTTGLGALGLLGWRRKRKNGAARTAS